MANGFNIIYFPTILLAFILFVFSLRIARQVNSRSVKALIVVIAIICAVPAVVFIAYYFHFSFTETETYYYFRTITGIELLTSLVGIFLGVLLGLRYPRNIYLQVMTGISIAGILLIPHIKPLIGPLKDSDFNEKWVNQVAMQSTQASCGPSSAATLLRHFGKTANEFDLARRAHTWENGTEIWYLAKELRNRGLKIKYQFGIPNEENIPHPSIAGVSLKRFGHFIAIIDKVGDTYIIGDSLKGRLELKESEIMQIYKFTGFFMSIQLDKN